MNRSGLVLRSAPGAGSPEASDVVASCLELLGGVEQFARNGPVGLDESGVGVAVEAHDFASEHGVDLRNGDLTGAVLVEGHFLGGAANVLAWPTLAGGRKNAALGCRASARSGTHADRAPGPGGVRQ